MMGLARQGLTGFLLLCRLSGSPEQGRKEEVTSAAEMASPVCDIGKTVARVYVTLSTPGRDFVLCVLIKEVQHPKVLDFFGRGTRT